MSRALAAVVACALLAACDFGGVPAAAPTTTAPAGTSEERLGAPEEGLADSIAGIRAQVRTIALEWQDEPVLAEMTFGLGQDGTIASADLTYLAAASERLLVIEGTDEGFGQQRTTLSTLGLPPVDADGVAAVPELPEGVREPQALAQAVADACGFAPEEVRYGSGAPWSWDGESWTSDLLWSATAVAGDQFVLVDPVSATPGC